MSTTFDDVRENLELTVQAGNSLLEVALPEGPTMKFRRIQGPQSGENGREFSVSGPKADVVRALIFAGAGLTRKQIAELAKCSVSRVSEVVWGLEYDRDNGRLDEVPEIPLRADKPAAEPKPGVTPRDEKPLTAEQVKSLTDLIEESIANVKAAKAEDEAIEELPTDEQ